MGGLSDDKLEEMIKAEEDKLRRLARLSTQRSKNFKKLTRSFRRTKKRKRKRSRTLGLD